MWTMSQDLKNSAKSGIAWGWIVFGLISAFVVIFFLMKLSGGVGQSFISYFMTIDEYTAERAQYDGRIVKLAGFVREGSLSQPEPNVYRFVAEYGGESFPIEFRGIVPDTFQEGVEVVVGGVASASHEVFLADELMAKCASKYEVGDGLREADQSPSYAY